jgi:glutathione synthase
LYPDFISKKESFLEIIIGNFKMNICFIMYPWDKVEPETDSTIRLVHEAVSRKHTVALTTPGALTMRNSVAAAFCNVFIRQEKVVPNMVSFYKRAEFKKQLLPLSGFDVIFMRANPPLESIMLNFLDSVKHDTFILNSVEGLREANNKLYTAAFHDPKNEIIPVTHVSKNKEYLKRVIRESEKEKMILKPLTGYGGSGVILIEKSAMQNISSLLDYYIDGKDGSNYVIIQDYIEGADQGDVRVLMLNGEPIGAMKRIPDKEDMRSNIHAGGTVARHVLTKNERRICKKVGKKLVADGLYFVGLDLINEKLIEVNVLSPGGIMRINKLNRVKLQKDVLDFVEDVVNDREEAIARKRAYKKTVEDA